MGGAAGLCPLSGLPIVEGESVLVFPLLRNLASGVLRDSPCEFMETSDLFCTSSAPFYGEYDGYGGAKSCRGLTFESTICHIGDLADININPDDFFDVLSRDGIKASKNGAEISVAFVRADVVERLWNDWSHRMPFAEEEQTYAQVMDLIPEFLEECADLYEKDVARFKENAANRGTSTDVLDVLISGYPFVRGMGEERGPLSEFLGDSLSILNSDFMNFADVERLIKDAWLGGRREDAYALVQDMMKARMVNHFMLLTRKIWTPSLHQGSEEVFVRELGLINEITKDVLETSFEYQAEARLKFGR